MAQYPNEKLFTRSRLFRRSHGRSMTFKTNRILVVDDDRQIGSLLCAYLADFGMHADAAFDGSQMRGMLSHENYSLIVLDLMLPGEDGLSLYRWLRTGRDTPVIMLTARGESADRVLGLELGAEDYVVKPFDPRELVARIQSVLRRFDAVGSRVAARSEEVSFGSWRLRRTPRNLIDPDGMVVPLSNAEFRLLDVFLSSPRRVMTRDELLDAARGRAVEAFDRSIDLLISRLRQKLREDVKEPKMIRTIRGEGYLFDCQDLP